MAGEDLSKLMLCLSPIFDFLKSFAKRGWIFWSLLIFGLAVSWVILQRQTEKPTVAMVKTAKTATDVPEQVAAAPGARLNFADFKKRPLPVTQHSATHEWTEGDGRDPQVVQQIAHNEDEFIRLMEENERIIRRQLVYRNDTAAAVIQRSKLNGGMVNRLVLPGLDGKELDFEITGADLEPSGQIGSFSGHLADRPTSRVSIAFKFGREAFTVMSADDGIFLQGSPRESGEIIVTSFDPDTYSPPLGEDHIKTSENFKSAQ